MDLTILNYVAIYVIAMIVFLGIDLLWLAVIAKDLYEKQLGKFMGTPKAVPAIIFYAVFIVGMMVFAIVPAINEDSVTYAMGFGALYGFFTYATYGLTNYATLKKWPSKIVPIDLAWGTALAAVVSTVTFSIFQAL